MLLATYFNFISSSCSFAALATTRLLFAKGAALIPSLAFLLEREFFAVDYTLFLNLGFLILTAIFVVWSHARGIDLSISNATGERILLGLALLAFAWLAAD